MPAILTRILFLYHLLNSILLYLLPKKKLTAFLPTSWYNCNHSSSTTSFPSPSRIPPTTRMDTDDLTRVFQMFDRNGDGRITHKELNDSLENMGIFIPNAELTQMIAKMDVDGDGCIDLGEFGELYHTILMEERGEEEDLSLREAFNVFDQNGDGFITVDELITVLASLGLKQGRTTEDGKVMIRKVDVDGDGMVNFVEFKQMMKAGGFSNSKPN